MSDPLTDYLNTLPWVGDHTITEAHVAGGVLKDGVLTVRVTAHAVPKAEHITISVVQCTCMGLDGKHMPTCATRSNPRKAED